MISKRRAISDVRKNKVLRIEDIRWRIARNDRTHAQKATIRQRRLEASEHFRAIPYAEVIERLMAR